MSIKQIVNEKDYQAASDKLEWLLEHKILDSKNGSETPGEIIREIARLEGAIATYESSSNGFLGSATPTSDSGSTPMEVAIIGPEED